MTGPDDPTLRSAVQKMMNAFEHMAHTRASVERTPIPSFDQPKAVDSSMMFAIASLPGASPELRAFASRVGAGECGWDEIETLSRPVPREVAELKSDPMVIWFPPGQRVQPRSEEPYRIPWQ
ncbi:MAG: hypothetical protein WBQ44_10510 [Rhodococcus sp. (in: high G+C Gram-positive bacteria)]